MRQRLLTTFAIIHNGWSYSSNCVTGWNTAAGTTTAGAPRAPLVGDQIPLGTGATLTFIAVNGGIIGGGSVFVSNENDRSIAVLVKHGGFDYLWASDLGGRAIDTACTGRSTTQVDVESAVITAISPGGAFPLISAGGIDVLEASHHGESSTKMNWMNMSRPAVALIGTGAGQSPGWQLGGRVAGDQRIGELHALQRRRHENRRRDHQHELVSRAEHPAQGSMSGGEPVE